MQVIESVHGFERPTTHRLQPGLDVSVLAVHGSGGRSRLRLGVRGGIDPVRVHLYVDGTLMDSWTNAPSFLSVDLGDLDPGRHAVTARAIDATGRWGGSSLLVESAGS